MKLMFTDLETTGFSREWDSIIEIAATIFDEDTWENLGTFHEYINPGKTIPAKITEITGITNEQVKNCRSEKEVLLSFFEWVAVMAPDKVVGHNYNTFDGQFVDARASKFGLTPYKLPVVDTLVIARTKKIPVNFKTATGKPSYTQPSLADYYGIIYEAHSAIEDIFALSKIYKKMVAPENDVKATRKNLGF